MLLAEYLEINQAAAARARAAGLLYGVDIPFWWHMPDEVTGEPIGIVTFRGERKLVTEHLTGFVDNIGIMAYRNVAAGPDGIITLALDTIQRVERTRNVRAFVGIETEKVREGVPATITFSGKTLLDMREEIARRRDSPGALLRASSASPSIATGRSASCRRRRERGRVRAPYGQVAVARAVPLLCIPSGPGPQGLRASDRYQKAARSAGIVVSTN